MKVELMKVRRLFTDEEGPKWAEVEINGESETLTEIEPASIEVRPAGGPAPRAVEGEAAGNGKPLHWTQRPENKKKLSRVNRASALARSKRK